jgi:isopropylmalate/homocitrate/citramalate synthase
MKMKEQGDLSFVSHYNFANEVIGELSLPAKIRVHDVTLRDGEQQAGIAFNPEEKIAIAQLLDEAGVDRIEAGFPAVSRKDFEAIKTIANLGLKAKVYSFARCVKADVENALQCGVDGVALEIPSSDHLLKFAYKWPEDRAIQLATEATSYAHDKGLYVTFFTIDSTRASFDTCWRLINSVAEDGYMDSLAIVDTFGVCSPNAISYFVKTIKKRINKPVEIHVHNDFGLGVANTVAAVLAGAETVHVSVNGIGERTGNASLEQTVMALRLLYGVESNVKPEMLRKVSRTVAEFSRVAPPPQAPIVGDGIFTIESGIVAGWWANVETTKPLEIYPFLPEFVGHDPVKVVVGKKSGRDSVLYMARKYGISLADPEVDEVLLRLKSEAILKKRSLSDAEFLEITDKVRKGLGHPAS